jgi:putative proteasome-type protease
VTYCLGIKVREGLIGLADGRITSGTQLASAHKMTLHGVDGMRFFVMTSGLRSLRDKVIAYLDRALAAASEPPRTMLDAVGVYTGCLRVVTEEDKGALERSLLGFDLHALIGGQLADDPEPTIFLVYPVGNWIQIGERTPYLAIGNTGYGKPILDRALRFETPMRTALKLAYLSFDSTRLSSADVGYPLDLATLQVGERNWRQAQFQDDELRHQGDWWNEQLKRLAETIPDAPWLGKLLP